MAASCLWRVAIFILGGCDSTEPSGQDGPIPVLSNRIAVDGRHTCLLGTGGVVRCWGPEGLTEKSTPPGAAPFVGIQGGIDHFCGISADNTAYCWGRNAFGQLGDGTRIDRDVPTRVSTVVKFATIQTAARASYALDASGRLYTWGGTLNGALGNGVNDRDIVVVAPAAVSTEVRFRQLGLGCALSTSKRGYCWGTQKPAGSTTPVHIEPGDCDDAYYFYYSGRDCLFPTPVASTMQFVDVGGCFLDATGDAYCVGDGFYGELGDGRSGAGVYAITPAKVIGGVKFRDLSARCGIDTAGHAYCWGNNAFGQLGIGVTGGLRSQPTAVATDQTFVAIVSLNHSCGLTATNRVWCWGANDSGQLGPGAPPVRTDVPVDVSFPPD